LWAAERCLRAGTCAAVIAWPGPGSERLLRRLQLAAEEGKSLGVIFGPTRNAANASPAALRIQLNAGRGKLGVQILKRRGGGWAPPLSLELDKEHACHALGLPSSPRFRAPAAAAGSGIVRAGRHHHRRQPAAGSLL
jgi:hypothetical protein